jgi:hypothetical protein
MLQSCASATALRIEMPKATNNFSLLAAATGSKLELCVDCNPPGHGGGSSTGCGKNSYFEPLEFQHADSWMEQYGTAAFQWKQAEGQLTLTKGGGKCVGAVKSDAGATIGMQTCSGASKWSYDSSTQQLRLYADSVLGIDASPLCLGYGTAASGPVRRHTPEVSSLRLDVASLTCTLVHLVQSQAAGPLTLWTIDRPYTVDLDESSLVAITPYIGQIAFNGNHYSDGGEIQFCE